MPDVALEGDMETTGTAPHPKRKRLTSLLVVAVLLAGLAGYSYWPEGATDFQFRNIDSPAGYRAVRMGSQSTGSFIFAGLSGDAPSEDQNAALEEVSGKLCKSLFGEASFSSGTVPVALFTDYRCPYCKILKPILEEVSEEDGNVPIRYHELPVFGAISAMSARAALAADMQGAYKPFADRLMGSPFVPSPAYLESVAEDLGLDPQRLQTDMESPEVSQRMAESSALSKLFGFRGTPSLLIGRTVVEGAISKRQIKDLIALEREADTLPGCRA
jgi:predicted DsbA family dithiol-disulfide isomerase